MAKINFEDKVDIRPIGVHKEELRANDVNLIKAAINENADLIEMSGIFPYKGTANLTRYGNGNSSGGSSVEKLFFRVNPQDSIYEHGSLGGGGTGIISLKFPKTPKKSFNFDLDVHFSNQTSSQKNGFLKVNVSVGRVVLQSGVSVWENLRVSQIYNSSNFKYQFVFADDLEGNLIVGFKEQNTTSTPVCTIILSNLIIQGVGQNNPLDFYKGWEGFVFNGYYGYNSYRIRETVFLEAENTPISINDTNGVSKFLITDSLQFDKYFKFNPAEKEVCFDDSKVQKITDDVSKIINASSIINGAYNVTETTTKNSQTYFNLNDLFLRTENRVKYFNINTSALLIPKSFNTLLNDSPNFIDYCFYLQPIGSSFKPNTFHEPILVSKIRYTESDLMSATSHFNEFAIFDVFIMLRSESYNGNNTTQFVVKQNTYNSKSIIIDSITSINRLYINNSSNVKKLGLDVSFRLLTKININYDGKSNPTPWGFTSKCDTYNVTLIK